MGKYGINVPRGIAVGSLPEVKDAIQRVFPNESEVSFLSTLPYQLCLINIPVLWYHWFSCDIYIWMLYFYIRNLLRYNYKEKDLAKGKLWEVFSNCNSANHSVPISLSR
jgi:hypothetical protein